MKKRRDSIVCDTLPTQAATDEGTVLVTGATGYIGGRLVPELLDVGVGPGARGPSCAPNP